MVTYWEIILVSTILIVPAMYCVSFVFYMSRSICLALVSINRSIEYTCTTCCESNKDWLIVTKRGYFVWYITLGWHKGNKLYLFSSDCYWHSFSVVIPVFAIYIYCTWFKSEIHPLWRLGAVGTLSLTSRCWGSAIETAFSRQVMGTYPEPGQCFTVVCRLHCQVQASFLKPGGFESYVT